MGKLTKADVAKLSPDARYCGGSLFMLMEPGKGKLVFHMQESKPSLRTQAALDELVAAGLVSMEPFNRFGGVVYRPKVSFPRPGNIPPGDWPLTVPVQKAFHP